RRPRHCFLCQRRHHGPGRHGFLRQVIDSSFLRPSHRAQRQFRLDPHRLRHLGSPPRHRPRQHFVRRRPPRQRPKQHHHRHPRRPGRHGRLHALAPPPVGPTPHHPHDGDPPGRFHHRPPRRQLRQRPPHSQPGHPRPPTSLRHVPAPLVHQPPKTHGSMAPGPVPPCRRLGQRHPHHRLGPLWPPRLPKIRLARHRRRLTPL